MVKTDTIVRTAVLAVALINQIITAMGLSPLPLEDGFGELLAAVFTTGASLWAWWENNSFTKAAIEADKVMKELKEN